MTEPDPAELDRAILAAIRALADARRSGDQQAAESARAELTGLEAQRA